MTTPITGICPQLSVVRESIKEAAERADRDPAGIRLLAVSKGFSANHIGIAKTVCGQIDFGENRVQEALDKMEAVTGSGARIHLIGTLQRNKARHAGAFASVQSIDSIRLAEAVSRRLDRELEILLEVNVAGEQSKSGFAPEDLAGALPAISVLPNLSVAGLMTVAPIAADPEDVRPVFRRLRELRDGLGLRELSMGMSSDYAVAIEEGATIVRIGRAIFGDRPA